MTYLIKTLVSSLALALCSPCSASALAAPQISHASSLIIIDQQRVRPIPVELYFPAKSYTCNSAHRCPVAILSAGYGISHKSYTFIAGALNDTGYLVVSVDHQLPSDPKMDRDGDVRQQLRTMSQQGALNIQHVQNALGKSYPGFDWQHVVLVGHSLGGDSSARRAGERDTNVAALITLDNRRAALPRTSTTKVLSIRAGDTEADPGVLPSIDEQRKFGACIVKIDGSRHNAMADAGSPDLKRKIVHAIDLFLRQGADGSHLYACDTNSAIGR